MKGYVGPIEELTEDNNYFRQVIFTSGKQQLVVMCLQKGEDIGMEVHPEVDQFFRIELGEGKVIMDEEETVFSAGDAIIVSAGTNHNVINTGDGGLKLYTVYSPPNHIDGTVHVTKADAVADEERDHFDGVTSETV